jgi:S1-C subfamily serine protease
VNVLDLFIVGVAVMAAVGGYRLGFVARSISWAGMAAGVVVAARVLPSVVDALEGGDQLRVLLTALGLLLGGAFLGQALGLVIGSRIHLSLPPGPARSVDRAIGAAVGVVAVVLGVWLLAPAASEVSGWPAEQTRTSSIAQAIDAALPPPPDPLQTLRQLVGEDRFPQVFDALRPAPDPGPPPADSGLTAAVAATVAESTVKVEGLACGRVQDGSGSVVGDDLVLTNAHVVAGSDDLEVETSADGSRHDAVVVAFDPARDLALLSVPGLGRPRLPLGDVDEGGVGAVFGHPGGGPLEISPFQVGNEITATGTDI